MNLVRHAVNVSRVLCDCGLLIVFARETRFVGCSKCQALHMKGDDIEANLPSEEDTSLRFVMLAGSHVTVSGGALGMFTLDTQYRFGCTVPSCEWQGAEKHLRQHYEWHRMLEPKPVAEYIPAKASIPLD